MKYPTHKKKTTSRSKPFDVAHDTTADFFEMRPTLLPSPQNLWNKRNKAKVMILENWHTHITSRNCRGDLQNTPLSRETLKVAHNARRQFQTGCLVQRQPFFNGYI